MTGDHAQGINRMIGKNKSIMCVLITYYHSLSTVALVSSPDPTQKQSSEPCQISWASTHSYDIQCTVATFKTVYARPAQIRVQIPE